MKKVYTKGLAAALTTTFFLTQVPSLVGAEENDLLNATSADFSTGEVQPTTIDSTRDNASDMTDDFSTPDANDAANDIATMAASDDLTNQVVEEVASPQASDADGNTSGGDSDGEVGGYGGGPDVNLTNSSIQIAQAAQAAQANPKQKSVRGFIRKSEDADVYYLEFNDKYLILQTDKYDIIGAVKYLTSKEIVTEANGVYDEKNNVLYLNNINIVSKLSETQDAGLKNAIEEEMKKAPVNAKGYIKKDGEKFVMEIKDKIYNLDAKKNDIKAVLPILAGKEILVQVVGPLNKETKTISVTAMGTLSALETEMKKKLEEAIFNSFDGEEIDATGRLVETKNQFFIRIKDEKYEVSTDREDIKAILPIVSETELPVKVTGKLDLKNKKIISDKISILQQPSKSVQTRLATAMAPYREEDGAAVGLLKSVPGKLDEYSLLVKDQEYLIKLDEKAKDDLKAFLAVVADQDMKLQINGYISNRTKTIKAKSATMVDTPSKELRDLIRKALEKYLPKYEDGDRIVIKGNVDEVDSKLVMYSGLQDFTVKAHEDYPMIKDVLALLKGDGVFLELRGLYDEDTNTVVAKELIVREELTPEQKADVEKIGRKYSSTTGSFSNNIGTAKDGATDTSKAGASSSGSFGTANGTASPFANFDWSKFKMPTTGTSTGSTPSTTAGTTTMPKFDMTSFEEMKKKFNESKSTTGTSPSSFGQLNTTEGQASVFAKLQEQLKAFSTSSGN